MNDLTGAPDRARLLNSLLLLWLSGTALRFTILAVPPVIPLIHDEMDLSATQVGILTGLPSMLFAIAAVPGALLIARLGVRTALVLGLAVNAIGGALRGAVPDIFWLYAMTIAMGAGVAIMQVTLPPAVRLWLPHKIGLATAVYTNGLLVGEIRRSPLLPLFCHWSAPGSWVSSSGACRSRPSPCSSCCFHRGRTRQTDRRRAGAGGRTGIIH
jgi:CP family cyanate transporter-like MFS transporter